jgi:hypothetical protein
VAQQSYPNASHSGGDLTATEYEKWAVPSDLTGLVGLPSDPKPVFADGTARAVKIRAGTQVKVRGQLVEATSDESIAIGNNGTGATRLDLIVAGLNRTTGVVTFYAVAGTASLPAPVTTDPSNTTGKYEMPLAKVAAPTGSGNLIDSQVTTLGWCLGEPIYLCTKDTRPPHRFGRKIREYDTGNEYTSDGTNWTSEVSDSGWIGCSKSTNWEFSGTGAAVRKVNNLVTLNCGYIRKNSSIGPHVQVQMGTVPVGYRPDRTIPIMGYTDGGYIVYGFVNPDGGIWAGFYYTVIAANATVTLSATSWPVS